MPTIPRTIWGFRLDATITTASETPVREYGLDREGFRLEPGPFDRWVASLEDAIAENKPAILPLWTPYDLDAVHALRVLPDPKNIFGDANRRARRSLARARRRQVAGMMSRPSG